MANDAKKQPIKFLFEQCLLEVHSRDIDFAKSEQSYHLTSTDAEAAAVRLLLPLHRKRYIRVILHYMHICEMALNAYLIRCLIP